MSLEICFLFVCFITWSALGNNKYLATKQNNSYKICEKNSEQLEKESNVKNNQEQIITPCMPLGQQILYTTH